MNTMRDFSPGFVGKTKLCDTIRSSKSTSFTMYSPILFDILWEALKAAHLLDRLRAVDGMGRLVAGELSVGGCRFIIIDEDEG